MKIATLCLPIDQARRRVLLGHKQRGFGQGKLVGIGGKVEPGEALPAAAARELREEAGLAVDPAQMEEAAHLTFYFPGYPDWDHRMHVFVAHTWLGEPVSSEEIIPEWQPLDALPYDRMWDDGRLWLPQVLAGQHLIATFVYGEDRQTVVAAAVRSFLNGRTLRATRRPD
jgi:8-oxo-dGTP diphosphatase